MTASFAELSPASLITAATPAPAVHPGNAEWQARVTATKVAGILGVSPWGDTPFTVWHLLAGNIEPDTSDDSVLARGRHLEAGIANWWLDDHPGYDMADAGTWQSIAHPWAYATPDRLLHDTDTGEVELLEVKTARSLDEWGEEGSDQIPPNYWAQCAWQAIVLGVRRVHVTVLGPWLERSDYTLTFDPFELGSVFETVADFVATLPSGDEPGTPPEPENPGLDWATMLAVTKPMRKQSDVSGLYDAYREAKAQEKAAKEAVAASQAAIKVAGAEAEELVVGKRVVATRSGANFRFKPVK